ncbi:MAG: hypothetical protein JSW28_02185 [Thermoplasmata archaeon]|nr:MAG: hypothetical protein JSW28_02185 [Thermoplasmata archaeon]
MDLESLKCEIEIIKDTPEYKMYHITTPMVIIGVVCMILAAGIFSFVGLKINDYIHIILTLLFIGLLLLTSAPIVLSKVPWDFRIKYIELKGQYRLRLKKNKRNRR